MRPEVERSIKQAERDLDTARALLGIERYEVASFMAHQAVEKLLKAAWIVVKREVPPRTHSLTELGDALGVPEGTRPALAHLNPDYVTARYPDAANGVPYEVYDRPTAEGKVRAAEEAFTWVRELIATSG